jgi:hypothetical protein
MLISCLYLARTCSANARGWLRGVRERVSFGRPRVFSSAAAKAAFKRARLERAEQLIDLTCSLDRATRAQVIQSMKSKVSILHFQFPKLVRKF